MKELSQCVEDIEIDLLLDGVYRPAVNESPFVSRYKAIAEGQGLYRRVV